jgi:cation transport regulator ChaC
MYHGKHLFGTTAPIDLATFALNAKGSSGRCRDYIDSIHQQLKLLGIDDPAVSALWKSLQKLLTQQAG